MSEASPSWHLHHGDALAVLREMESCSVDCCVCSPPYWGLRDYQVAGQQGLEPTPAEYVAGMVAVFREVRRVLKDDGTLWLNLGDSYTGSGKGGNPDEGKQATNVGSQSIGVLYGKTGELARQAAVTNVSRRMCAELGAAPKNLVGIPWRVAFALQADGWYLRSDIIWSKPNPMPESVTDRPTKAHEYLFLLSKSERYHYDAAAVAEDAAGVTEHDLTGGIYSPDGQAPHSFRRPKAGATNGLDNPRTPRTAKKQDALGKQTYTGFNDRWRENPTTTRNKRTVWTIATEPFPDAHFAVMPTALVKPCVLAGCRVGGTVLDPFAGSGTVGVVAMEHGCDFVGIDLNPAYVEIARKRLTAAQMQGRLDFATGG